MEALIHNDNILSDSCLNLCLCEYKITVVGTFNIQHASGKKVHIYDQLNTIIDTVDILKYLLKANLDSLVLRVEFLDRSDVPPNNEQELITSKVWLWLFLFSILNRM